MPQDIDLHMPFPPCVNSDLSAARVRNLTWMRRHQLIGSAKASQQYLRWQMAEMAAYAYPEACDKALDLATDMMGWFFIFDDQLDGGSADAMMERARSVCRDLCRVIDNPEAVQQQDPPIVVAFADCWARERVDMPTNWCRRAAAHWKDYITVHLDEAQQKLHRTPPRTIPQYLSQSRRAVGVLPCLDLAESVGKFAVPHSAVQNALLRTMTTLTCDHIILVNDICSLEKEAARGDPFNLILLIEREHRSSQDQAIETVRRMADTIVEKFTTLESGIPGLCASLRLSPEGCVSVNRYVRAMRYWLRGNYDWERHSGRYVPAYNQSAERPAFIEDLITDLP